MNHKLLLSLAFAAISLPAYAFGPAMLDAGLEGGGGDSRPTVVIKDTEGAVVAYKLSIRESEVEVVPTDAMSVDEARLIRLNWKAVKSASAGSAVSLKISGPELSKEEVTQSTQYFNRMLNHQPEEVQRSINREKELRAYLELRAKDAAEKFRAADEHKPAQVEMVILMAVVSGKAYLASESASVVEVLENNLSSILKGTKAFSVSTSVTDSSSTYPSSHSAKIYAKLRNLRNDALDPSLTQEQRDAIERERQKLIAQLRGY